ncbi:MAG: right-handed parallel beta-helix repeat-containing protein, partial [Bradymonadaceae bacterium]
YDQGETEHEITRDLESVGSQEGSKPVIVGASDLLSITGSAFVALLGVELRSAGKALQVGDDAAVSVTQVDCRASRCITTGKFIGEGGGRVTVQRSTLTGAGSAMQGILAFRADEITVANSTIEGFSGTGQGIKLLQSSATIRDTVIRDSEIGIDLLANNTEHAVLIRDSQLSGNEIGLKTSNAKNLTVRTTTIDTSSETGIAVRGGATYLDSLAIRNGGGDGMVIDDVSGGAVVIVRQSSIISHVGDGILVEGQRATLDLGNETTMGGNEIRFCKGASLHGCPPRRGHRPGPPCAIPNSPSRRCPPGLTKDPVSPGTGLRSTTTTR